MKKILNILSILVLISTLSILSACGSKTTTKKDETFNFDDMCDVEIPIPDITIQRSIANIYEVYVERKEINERLKEQIRDLCPILIKGSIDEAS